MIVGDHCPNWVATHGLMHLEQDTPSGLRRRAALGVPDRRIL